MSSYMAKVTQQPGSRAPKFKHCATLPPGTWTHVLFISASPVSVSEYTHGGMYQVFIWRKEWMNRTSFAKGSAASGWSLASLPQKSHFKRVATGPWPQNSSAHLFYLRSFVVVYVCPGGFEEPLIKMRGRLQCHGRLRADLLIHIPPHMPQRVSGQATPPEVSTMVAAGAICRAPFQPIVLCRDGLRVSWPLHPRKFSIQHPLWRSGSRVFIHRGKWHFLGLGALMGRMSLPNLSQFCHSMSTSSALTIGWADPCLRGGLVRAIWRAGEWESHQRRRWISKPSKRGKGTFTWRQPARRQRGGLLSPPPRPLLSLQPPLNSCATSLGPTCTGMCVWSSALYEGFTL